MNYNILKLHSAGILSRLFGTKFFSAILIVLVFASCNKDNNIGIDVQPEEDLIGLFTNDTTTLYTYTVREDSLRTDEAPKVIIGKYQDAVFGTSTCGLFSQFAIPNNLTQINFQGGVLDSAVLMLAYDFDYYGDTTVAQTFAVHQMTAPIYKDSVYYSNRMNAYNPMVVGQKTFTPAPRSKVAVGNDTVPAHIRITLDYNWASIIFAQSGGTNLNGNTNWLNYMNGLYIEPVATGGGLVYLDMLDTLTGLRLYYHTATDTTNFTFVVNSTTAYYSHYAHDYTGTPDIAAQLADPSNPFYPMNHIQSNAGLKTKIEFPFLDNYRNLGYPIAINKAELVIKGDETYASDNFPLNTRYFVTSIDSTGKENLLIDMYETSTYYGGELNTTTNEYRINIARYMQGILNGTEENNGLYLKEIFGAENGRRSVIGSGAPTSGNRMYLRLVYTRIN